MQGAKFKTKELENKKVPSYTGMFGKLDNRILLGYLLGRMEAQRPCQKC
jgi:hypothetical protein